MSEDKYACGLRLLCLLSLTKNLSLHWILSIIMQLSSSLYHLVFFQASYKFFEHLLCAKQCTKHWALSSEQNKILGIIELRVLF